MRLPGNVAELVSVILIRPGTACGVVAELDHPALRIAGVDPLRRDVRVRLEAHARRTGR